MPNLKFSPKVPKVVESAMKRTLVILGIRKIQAMR